MDRCDDQTETIAFLSQPGAYALAGPVERIDTHAAIVFLVGDRAYKLKRAVRYPYLDFSTAEKRKAVCETELALNRRTAPDLYLGVQPVGRSDDGTLAIGLGTPVDWLLVMRRFAPECLLDAMAREGALDPRLVRELADAIAAFHDGAKAVPGPGAGRVRAVIEGNRASMAALPDALLPADECERLYRRSLALLDELAPLLDSRAASGHVRHCHGDLHLANICLWHGRPTLFDCLEFDTALATTDVLYDLAFLLMDLWQRGLRAEASLAFNRYCDMRGESDGLAALPLFLSMRAAVRAHVTASAAGRQPDAAGREERQAAARAYLAAALVFLDRQPPRLIAVGGLSGTGKSTLAGGLAPHLGAPPGARWLRSDVLRKRLAGVVPEAPLPATGYTAERSRAVYDRLIGEARRALAAGTSVIVDAVFAAPAERAAVAGIADAAGVPFLGLWLEAAPDVLRARVGERRGDASDADAAVVDRQLGYALGDLTGWQRMSAAGSRDEVLAGALALAARQAPDGR
ncbi:MAG: AAA family ATPase [Novosphingobium sp.]